MHFYHFTLMVLVFLVALSHTSMQSPQEATPVSDDRAINDEKVYNDTMAMEPILAVPQLNSKNSFDSTVDSPIRNVSINQSQPSTPPQMRRPNTNFNGFNTQLAGGRTGGRPMPINGRSFNSTSNSTFPRGGGRRPFPGNGMNGRRFDMINRTPVNATN